MGTYFPQYQFVDQRNIHVTLNVLDHLGGFGNADRACAMGAGGNHLGINRINQLGGFGRRA
jgi:hypothetical protein